MNNSVNDKQQRDLLNNLISEANKIFEQISVILNNLNPANLEKNATLIGDFLDSKFTDIGSFLAKNFLDETNGSWPNCKSMIKTNVKEGYEAMKLFLKTDTAFKISLTESIKVAIALMLALTTLGLVFSFQGVAIPSTTIMLVNNLFTTAYYTGFYIMGSTIWEKLLHSKEVQDKNLEAATTKLKEDLKALQDLLQSTISRAINVQIPFIKLKDSIIAIFQDVQKVVTPQPSPNASA